MKPVFQTNNSVPGGDCLRACVASILELDIEEVPHFCGEKPHEEWFSRLAIWLRDRGLGCFYTTLDPICGAISGPCLLGVRTRKAEELNRPKDWIHCVVANAVVGKDRVHFEIIHDPDPGASEVLEYRDVTWIVRNVA